MRDAAQPIAIATLALATLAPATLALVCVGGVLSAQAQDASRWDGEPHGSTRLIAGGAVKSANAKLIRAGIEIRLDPGWKTYWRYPGDSGVPPTLDFAGSENIKSVTTLWPAPERFSDGGGGFSIGYRGDVVLPLLIVPNDADKPSSLRLKLGYAVCGKLCVPAQADLDLTLSGKAGAEEPTLVAAEARVPRHVALGEVRGLGIASVHRETEGKLGRVLVDVAVPDGVPIELFVEGPTSEWALPLPQPAGPTPNGAPGTRRFTFELDGLPPGASAKGALLTFTVVSPGEAIEVQARLD
jgi:DsbC/DsbD-like thiol-disulfide interchange protein